MKTVVFCGPSLPPSMQAPHTAGLTMRPPAECGDVYRAVRAGAERIGLIDGYFDHRLAVWHKEILWALSRGVYVYGASSMGAMRAAELESYGMVGVGAVFAQYRDGLLEDDDEVALAHQDAEHDYRAVSEALVNVRATLHCARDAQVISRGCAEQLETLAKARFYPERTYGSLFEAARTAGVPAQEVDALRTWLANGCGRDPKREDALALIARLRDGATPELPVFHFEHTDAWETLTRLLEAEPSGEATFRALALALGAIEGYVPSPAHVQRASESFRLQRGLHAPEETARWLETAKLDVEAFSELMYDEAIVDRQRSSARAAAHSQDAKLALLRKS